MQKSNEKQEFLVWLEFAKSPKAKFHTQMNGENGLFGRAFLCNRHDADNNCCRVGGTHVLYVVTELNKAI